MTDDRKHDGRDALVECGVDPRGRVTARIEIPMPHDAKVRTFKVAFANVTLDASGRPVLVIVGET